jgi:dTDP-glucose pyrophosphorylase
VAGLTVVIPMAGRGQRFVDAGVSVPKPLIEVRGRPMYSWAVASIPPAIIDRLVFICLAEHLEAFPLAEDIEDRYDAFRPVVVSLDGVTEGQACTVLAAREHLDPAAPLVIYNADTYCVTGLEHHLGRLDPAVDGIIGVFEAPGDHWSFARVDDRGRVVETAEKRRISPWATTGLYHFSRAADFLEHTDAMVAADERTNGEFYVAPVYNRLIAAGARIEIDVALEVWALGTPEELARFEQEHPS